MANIIPMAGKGSRFDNEGFLLPKPLIPVSGMPMIINVIHNMPESDKWIFIVRQEHIDEYRIDELLRNEKDNVIIIPVSGITEGQACTCMLAEPYLDSDEQIHIAACDNSYIYNKEKYKILANDKNIDSIVWTFTRHETLMKNPNARGWCRLEDDGMAIKDMSVKTPISSSPFNDHAVVSTFFFRHAHVFFDAARLMIKENFRINNEFYVDAVPIFLKKLGKKSVIFDIDYYLDWGTPEDLYKYQRLEYLCKYNIEPKNISLEDKKALDLMRKYFSQKR